jgi:hypothetical protein
MLKTLDSGTLMAEHLEEIAANRVQPLGFRAFSESAQQL